MRHSRYKYFSNVDYAKQFLDGNMFHQTAAYFRDYEDREAQQIIGDEYEGKAVACVEICDPRQFIRQWLEALPDEAKKDDKHVSRMVGYYRPEDLPGNVWALPDLITTTKLKRFAYQEEYRFAYTVTDAFAFQNCTYQLVDRKARPLPKPEEHHHETPPLGDLRDICKVHEF